MIAVLARLEIPVAVGTATDASESLAISEIAGGYVTVAGVTASHALAVHGSCDGKAFVPLHDGDGQAVTLRVPPGGGQCALPDVTATMRYLKLIAAAELDATAIVLVTPG